MKIFPHWTSFSDKNTEHESQIHPIATFDAQKSRKQKLVSLVLI